MKPGEPGTELRETRHEKDKSRRESDPGQQTKKLVEWVIARALFTSFMGDVVRQGISVALGTKRGTLLCDMTKRRKGL